MILSVLVGNIIQADISGSGVSVYTAQAGAIGWGLFALFAFGFPTGLGLAAVGAASAGGTTPRRWGITVLLTAAAVLTPLLVPVLSGRAGNPVFFSTGGYIILALSGLTMWLWSARRRSIPPEARLPVDLQGAGYACFGMAAWNICGIGGMPSFSLRPEKAVELGSAPFAVGQMKAVMVLLVLGWVFTVLGIQKSR